MFLLDRLYHFHWVTKDGARSAQPYLGFYGPFLKSHGIKSIINLRGENPKRDWWHKERAEAERAGAQHFDVRLDTRKLPAQDRIRQLFHALANATTPILFKCSGGQDRTSLAAAFFLLDRCGPSALPAAQTQFAGWPYMHRPEREQEWMREMPVFAVEDAAGLPLREWARRYEPERFEAWLRARGMGDRFERIQTPWPITPPTAL